MHKEFPRPKKYLGQNFLKDKEVLDRFIKACDLSKDDVVVEVGAGTGVITKELAKRVKKVIAYELDKEFIPSLQNLLNRHNLQNVEVRNEDILKSKSTLRQAPAKRVGRQGNLSKPISKIVGAIPYQITSPLLHKIILDLEEKPTVVFIVQKEVAEKVVAHPPCANYLSNFVSLYGGAEIVGPPILPSAFYPEPKVNSTILRIIPNLKLSTFNFQLSTFLHHGFKNPRKMLNKAFDPDTLRKAGIDPTLRPQNLALEDWVRLFDTMKKGYYAHLPIA